MVLFALLSTVRNIRPIAHPERLQPSGTLLLQLGSQHTQVVAVVVVSVRPATRA